MSRVRVPFPALFFLHGDVPKWLKGEVCKTFIHRFESDRRLKKLFNNLTNIPMSALFKARGTSSVGLLIIRLIAGSYTLILGIKQASNIELYISRVKAMEIFSQNTSFVIGFALPFLLILLGTLYIMGFFTPPTSLLLALISLLKILSRGLFPTDGIPFNKDLLFLACFLMTLFAGAGVISFDVFLDKKKKKVVEVKETPEAVVTAEVVSEPSVQEQTPPVSAPPQDKDANPQG
jgi:uncharacterized membrane protein YphA (DoxX/SURF4 family)